MTIPIHHERTNGHFERISPGVLRLDSSFGCRTHKHRHVPPHARYAQMVDNISVGLLLGMLAAIACAIATLAFGLFQFANFVISNWRHA